MGHFDIGDKVTFNGRQGTIVKVIRDGLRLSNENDGMYAVIFHKTEHTFLFPNEMKKISNEDYLKSMKASISDNAKKVVDYLVDEDIDYDNDALSVLGHFLEDGKFFGEVKSWEMLEGIKCYIDYSMAKFGENNGR